ncbi:MAG: NTP transferase domain-containing protein [bacterium]
MNSGGFTALILAAGKGTRMRSGLPKVLHSVGGEPMVLYPVRLFEALGARRIIVVIGHGARKVRRVLGEGVETVVQSRQLGTGHAATCAAPLFAREKGTLAVTYGDMPLLRPRTVERLLRAHERGANAATVLTAVIADPPPFGRVIRARDGAFVKILEAKDCSPRQLKINEVNSGAYCFNIPPLLEALKELDTDNAQGEYYLTDVVGMLAGRGLRVGTLTVEDNREIHGINTADDLAEANRLMEEMSLEAS